jgi:hypothetical protein
MDAKYLIIILSLLIAGALAALPLGQMATPYHVAPAPTPISKPNYSFSLSFKYTGHFKYSLTVTNTGNEAVTYSVIPLKYYRNDTGYVAQSSSGLVKPGGKWILTVSPDPTWPWVGISNGHSHLYINLKTGVETQTAPTEPVIPTPVPTSTPTPTPTPAEANAFTLSATPMAGNSPDYYLTITNTGTVTESYFVDSWVIQRGAPAYVSTPSLQPGQSSIVGVFDTEVPGWVSVNDGVDYYSLDMVTNTIGTPP